jgi:hypothetical protein
LYAVLRSTLRLVSIIPMGASAERVVFRRTDGPFFPIVRGWVAESGLINGQAGLEVYDFGDIILPQLEQTVACSGSAEDVAFAGLFMLVAEGNDGCEMFELDAAGGARPIGYYPEASYRVVGLGTRFAVAPGTSGLLLIDPAGCPASR